MTGSAKQSIFPLRREMDCFASLAMTWRERYPVSAPSTVISGHSVFQRLAFAS